MYVMGKTKTYDVVNNTMEIRKQMLLLKRIISVNRLVHKTGLNNSLINKNNTSKTVYVRKT